MNHTTSSGEAKVCDFGLAADLDASRTHARGMVGTPLYASPKQFRFSEPDPRMDVYGLGAVLYEVITGRTPF
ncbi:MAG: protein kinase, partial [Planctomycetota bacterium]